MDRPLIIGAGNRFRRDDGAGPLVAERLRALGLKALELPGEGTELIEAWTGRAWVIVVDAARSGAAPGTIHRFEAAQEELPRGFFSYSTHQFGLAEAVETARALGRLPDRLTVYGVEGGDFAFGGEMTAAVVEACEIAAREIAAEVQSAGST